jgi:hypothetical protein
VAYVLLAIVVAAALQASVVYRDFCRQAGAGVFAPSRPGSPPPCSLSSLPATSSGYTAARANIV